MAASDMIRAAKDMQGKQQEMVDALGGPGGGGLGKTVGGLVAFFTSPDNLMALAVCLLALMGIYALLRSENVLPRVSLGGGRAMGHLTGKLMVRLTVMLLLGAMAMALIVPRLAGLFGPGK